MSASRTLRCLPLLVGLLLLVLAPPAIAGNGAGASGAAAPLARKEAAHHAVEVLDTAAQAGKEQQAELRIVPREGYKVNLDYPTRIKLQASAGTRLTAESLSKGDALELSKEVARFPVRYVPSSPGKAELKAEVRFSVCNDKQCDLAKEEIAWSVKVEK